MALLIDGYNLLYAAAITGDGRGKRAFERSRIALLNFVVDSIEPAEVPKTTVVFDAAHAPPGLPRTMLFRGLTVRFAAEYASADELIEELIQQSSAPRQLLVVSSDHRLHRAAKRRRARVLDSEQWYDEMVSARRQRQMMEKHPAAETTPDQPLDTDVAYWLAQFEAEKTEADFQREQIFPPGYGEDLEEKD